MAFNEKNLEIATRVHKNLHSGDPITDEDLKAALPLFADVSAFFYALNDRRFDLFENHIRDDFQRLEGFAEARKRH